MTSRTLARERQAHTRKANVTSWTAYGSRGDSAVTIGKQEQEATDNHCAGLDTNASKILSYLGSQQEKWSEQSYF